VLHLHIAVEDVLVKKGRKMQHIPKTIFSTTVMLKDQLVVSIRTDRMLVVELGVNVVVMLSPQETALLLEYLDRHRKFFVRKAGQ
jgi:hypothetical protein